MENTKNKPPIRVFRSGPIKAAVWLRTVTRDSKDTQIHSVKISKSYRNKESGKWENTQHLFLSDLPRAAMLMAEVWRHYGVSAHEPETQSDETGDGHVEDLNDDLGTE
ncbi:hypothetical protein ACFL5F_04040 [Planctomycetota bacterium]